MVMVFFGVRRCLLLESGVVTVFGAGYWFSSAGLVGWPVCPLGVGWAWSSLSRGQEYSGRMSSLSLVLVMSVVVFSRQRLGFESGPSCTDTT